MKERLHFTIYKSERDHDRGCDEVGVKGFFNGCVDVTETCAQGENVEDVKDDICKGPHVGDCGELDVINDGDDVAEEDK